MKHKKWLLVEYFFIDYEQAERQKKLDDAFDVIFDDIETDDMERINKKDEHEHTIIIKR